MNASRLPHTFINGKLRASLVAALVGLCLLINLTPLPAQEWHRLNIPDAWRSVPGGNLKPIDGFSWYRALVRIPEDWHGQPLTLFTEALDDARSAWAGGQTVGLTGTFPPAFAVVLANAVGFPSKPRW